MGLNVILGEIRLPENKDKDTHNLGKSTLASLIDFCLLKGKSKSFFLFKHEELFKDFEFYLEVKLSEGEYLTIKRNVTENSKISIKEHGTRDLDFRGLVKEEWTHYEVPIKAARSIIDGRLNFIDLSNWSYRKYLGYALRGQNDFNDVFQLSRFAGSHSQWKPFLAHIMGFDSTLVEKHYDLIAEISETKERIKNLKGDLVGVSESADKLAGLILLKKRKINSYEENLQNFDFQDIDETVTDELVRKVEAAISNYNNQRYYIKGAIKRADASLSQHDFDFDVGVTEQLFSEAGVAFEGQIKKSFEDLVQFNNELTKERRAHLRKQLKEYKAELENINKELKELSEKKSDMLNMLKKADSLEKYKDISQELINNKTELQLMELQSEKLSELKVENSNLEGFEKDSNKVIKKIGSNIEKEGSDAGSLYSRIRVLFNEYVLRVLNKGALISCIQNDYGNIQFSADFLNEEGNQTSESSGYSYKKLLCIAFDLAVNVAYLNSSFPHFIYHDGALETLDIRKKKAFIELVRELSGDGLQYIFTMIDSELSGEVSDWVLEKEVVLTLHDDGDEGRLFKIPSW